MKIPLHIINQAGTETELLVEKGANLRQVLIANNLSPYTQLTQRLNCGGNGLCATCGVEILTDDIEPTHWHDKASKKFRYPRLSCQIYVEEPMTIRLVSKVIWGQRIKK